MINDGYDLDRGIKNSDNEHIDIKQYKKITRKLNIELTSKNEKLNKSMDELETKMSSNKETIFDKIKKDTFNSMNKVIEQTKKVMEMQPKIQNVYNEVNEYAKSYKYLEKENENIQKEVEYLRIKNQKLAQENNNLISYIRAILKTIKKFFRIGNDKVKEVTTSEIKDYYNKEDFDKDDIYDVAIDTEKEEKLFDYANIDKLYTKESSFWDLER